MFKFLQELQNTHQVITRTATSDGSIAGMNDVTTKAGTDVSFKNNQIDVNSQNGVDAAEVQDYLEKAKDINDEVDCVGFAVELDDSRLVKLYVNEKDAQAFEEELSTNLGVDKEFDELLIDLSKKYDVVDVIWPDQQDGVMGQPVAPDATAQDNAPSSEFSDQMTPATPAPAGTAVGEQPSPEGEQAAPDAIEPAAEKSQKQKDMDEFDELFGSGEPAPVDGATEGNEPAPVGGEAETSPEGEGEHKRSHHKKTDDESTESSEPTEGSAPESAPEGEHKRSHHKKPEGDDATDELPVEEPETTDTVEKADDDISVTIKHPKKKKKQVQESISTDEVAPPKTTKDMSIFKTLGLDNNYQLVGATLPHQVQDKILALLGILNVPGSSLTKYITLADDIVESSKLVIENGKLLGLFGKFFNAMVSASTEETSGYDAEYRTKLKNVLGKLGIVIDKLGTTISTNALVLGATIISNNQKVKSLFNQMEPIIMQEPPQTAPINESIGILKRHKAPHQLAHSELDDGFTFGSFVGGDDDKSHEDAEINPDSYDYVPRNHESFEQSMKDQDSSYREWLPRDDQVDLVNHYLSGVDIHCSTWKPHDGQSLEDHLAYIKREHIPKAHQEFAYGEFDDGSYEIIFIHPHAIDLSK